MNAPSPAGGRDPEDGAHSAASFWALRACEALVACMFATALPWQVPFAWFTGIAALGTLRWFHVNRPAFKRLPKARRQRVYRRYVWVLMSFVGSSCHFLYVPGNLPVQAVLLSYLLGNATLIAVRVTGDPARTVVGLCLAVVPTSLRCVLDGVGEEPLLALMGIGGLLMTATIATLSRAQESSVRAQVERRRRAENAAQAVEEVVVSKSRFFAAVSHDMRQPVHAIGLYLQPLQALSDRAGDAVAREAVENIRECWRAVDDLLHQLLDMARIDAGAVAPELRVTEIAPAVRAIVRQHGADAERAGVRLVALVAPGRFALADEMMLARVLSNLVDNALKFSHPGSSVAIALRGSPAHWKLQVRDAGIGIPASAQAGIFDEFVRAPSVEGGPRRGFGLGLPIARRFAELMQGTLHARSAAGCGCCMTLTLPKARESAACGP